MSSIQTLSNCYHKVSQLSECDINFDTPNRNEILKNGLRRASSENLLGRGTFGTVFKAIYKGKQVAVKIINNSNNTNRMTAVKNELNVLNWKHKNIIRILKVEYTSTHSAIIMERFQGQCLQSIIDRIELSLQHRFRIIKDVICGLNYCHKNYILHLDIKPQNILVAFNLELKSNILQNYSCKICDFGSSRYISDDYISNNNSKKSINLLPGTIRYMSPEALKNQILTPASDIYSFGITMWQLKSRIPPYFDIDCNDIVAYKVVKNNLRPNTPTEQIDNCFQFNNNHQNCLCQHFSSEHNSNESITKEDLQYDFKNFNSIYLKSLPFNKLEINSNILNKSSNNKTFKNIVKKSNKKLNFGLSVDFNKNSNYDDDNDDDNHHYHHQKLNDMNENQKINTNLEQIFFEQHRNLECDLKEQQYKMIYLKCWNSEPTDRPLGVQIENQINKLLI